MRPRPTRRQLEVLRAYVSNGSIAAAAQQLEIAESTARQHLSGLYHGAGLTQSPRVARAQRQAQDALTGLQGVRQRHEDADRVDDDVNLTGHSFDVQGGLQKCRGHGLSVQRGRRLVPGAAGQAALQIAYASGEHACGGECGKRGERLSEVV